MAGRIQRLGLIMRKKREVMHTGQIPTKLSIIKTELFEKGAKAINSLLASLISEPGSFEQKNHIIVTAALLEQISRLVYFGKDGYYCKLPAKTYYKEIFEGYAETPEEVFERIKRYGVSDIEKAKYIYKLVWQVADLVCPMMARSCEQAFVSEYAYAIEYVIKHDGNLPKPEILILFPTNYDDYKYTEGIAEEIRKYEI